MAQPIDAIFSSFNAQLEASAKQRELIKEQVSELSQIVRNIEFKLQRIQSRARDEAALLAACAEARALFPSLRPHWVELSKLLTPETVAQFRGMWQSAMSNLITSAGLIVFVESHALVSLEEATALVMGGQAAAAAQDVIVDVDVEEYLHGICALPKILSRLCVNSVTQENYELPGTISQFVSELYSGFRLLNLRNDALRRKFDGIKYSVQKIEEVMYDVQVRQLGGKQQAEADANDGPQAMEQDE